MRSFSPPCTPCKKEICVYAGRPLYGCFPSMVWLPSCSRFAASPSVALHCCAEVSILPASLPLSMSAVCCFGRKIAAPGIIPAPNGISAMLSGWITFLYGLPPDFYLSVFFIPKALDYIMASCSTARLSSSNDKKGSLRTPRLHIPASFLSFYAWYIGRLSTKRHPPSATHSH